MTAEKALGMVLTSLLVATALIVLTSSSPAPSEHTPATHLIIPPPSEQTADPRKAVYFSSKNSSEFGLNSKLPLTLLVDSPRRVVLSITTGAPLIHINGTAPEYLNAQIGFKQAHVLEVRITDERENQGLHALRRAKPHGESSPVILELSLPLGLGSFASVDWMMLKHTPGTNLVYTCPPGYTKPLHMSTGRPWHTKAMDAFACTVKPFPRLKAHDTWKAPVAYDRKAPDFLSNFTGTIMTQCFAINGNGYDWASTLSALASAMNVRAGQASALQASSGKSVLIYPHCITGGSSGSAVVGVYLNAIRNREIFKSQKDLGVLTQIPEFPTTGGGSVKDAVMYTPAQFQHAAKLLRFIALGLDFTLDELLYSGYTAISSHFRPNKNVTLHWWKSYLAGYPPQVLFAAHAFMARYAVSAEIEAPVSQVLHTTQIQEMLGVNLSSLNSHGATEVVELTASSPPHSQEYKKAFSLLLAQGMWAKHTGQSLAEARASYEGTKWSSRFTQHREHGTPLAGTLDERLGDWVSTSPMGVLFDTYNAMLLQNSTPPTYSQQRALIICNYNTAKALLASKRYQDNIKTDVRFARRYVVLVVSSYGQAFSMGVREPMTNDCLSGSLQELGVSHIYDPSLDQRIHDSFSFALQSTAAEIKLKDGTLVRPALAIIGGYPTANLMAVGQAWYVEAMVESLQAAAPHATIKAHHTRLLKTTPPLFAASVIEKVLSGPSNASNYSAIVATNKADWAVWGEDFENEVVGQYSAMSKGRVNLTADTVKVQWAHDGPGLWKLPAAVAQESYVLTPRGVAASRKQLGSDLSWKDVFYHQQLNYTHSSGFPLV